MFTTTSFGFSIISGVTIGRGKGLLELRVHFTRVCNRKKGFTISHGRVGRLGSTYHFGHSSIFVGGAIIMGVFTSATGKVTYRFTL